MIEKTTVGWVDKLSRNNKPINYLKEKLDMMSITSPEFSDLRATAIYERTLDELNELKENNEELKKQLAKFDEK